MLTRAMFWRLVLVFVLLVAMLLAGAYLIKRSRQPISTVHVSVDSVRIHKK